MKTLPLVELDNIFAEVENNISLLSSLAPVNLETEKQKFFESNYNYNPQFEYEVKDYSSQSAKLEDIQAEETEIGSLYNKKIQHLKNVLRLIKLVGKDSQEFTRLSEEIYGKPDTTYLELAKRIAATKIPKTESPMLEFDEIHKRVEDALRNYEMDAKIETKDDGSNRMHVDHHNNIIFIPRGLRRTEESLNRAIRHEIGVHLVRAQNGKKQKDGIFFSSTAGYLSTEEGLATMVGTLETTDKILFRPARIFICINAALQSDFKSTFNSLNSLIRKPQTSFGVALRAKRGISDTSETGGITKDLYFQWTIELGKKLLSSPDGLNYIMNGKASVDELMKFTEPSHNATISINQIENLFKQNNILK